LVNPSIKDEKECREYKFEKAKDIDSTVHTIEKTLCILINNQLMKYNDNSTVSLCKVIKNFNIIYDKYIYIYIYFSIYYIFSI